MATEKKKVTIVGSGNWGSAIARIVGHTVKTDPEKKFNETIVMWVWEEIINGEKLSEIINTRHENVKYLPGRTLPTNVVAVTDLDESIKDADILIFVVPHQFVEALCDKMVGKVKPTALGVSLIKGLEPRTGGGPERGIKLISEIIKEKLGIDCCVLMGANLAREVAAENFCEATVGAENKDHGHLLKDLFQTDYFRINHVYDAHTVELCGALKNVVACAAGFTDGLGYGDNTKSAVIRLGLMEMTKFIEKFYPGSNLSTFFESCGIADLVTTCYGGRNRRVCEAFVRTGKSLEELEVEMLGGQNLQGPHTADQVMKMLLEFKMEKKFPLFASVYHVCHGEMKPVEFIDALRNHPEHFDRN